MTFGTRFAVTYAALRHDVLTVPAKTTVRANPSILAKIVSPPMSNAALPTPTAMPLPAVGTGNSSAGGRSSAGRPASGLVRPGDPVSAGPPLGVTTEGSGGRARRISRATAQHVEPVQGRCLRDHVGEADLLARGRQRGHDAEHGD